MGRPLSSGLCPFLSPGSGPVLGPGRVAGFLLSPGGALRTALSSSLAGAPAGQPKRVELEESQLTCLAHFTDLQTQVQR